MDSNSDRTQADASSRPDFVSTLLRLQMIRFDPTHCAYFLIANCEHIASAAVVVDAKDANAYRFYSEFGFIAFPETANRLFLPMKTIEELFAGLSQKSGK